MSEVPPTEPGNEGEAGPFPSAPPPGPGPAAAPTGPMPPPPAPPTAPPPASGTPIGNMPPAAPPPYGTAPPNPAAPYGAPPHPAAPYGTAPPYPAPPYGTAPPYPAAPYGTAPPYPPAPYGAPPYGAPTGYPPGYGFPPQPPYASYWARVGGWLIDWVILAVVINVLNLGFNAARIGRVNFHVTTTVNGTSTIHHFHYSVVGGIVGLVLTLLYGAILCGSARGQTVGMMAVGARAVDGDHGGPIGFGRALWRAFFEYLMFVLCIIPWVLDMLWPAWDSRHQAWHDKVANTIVVKRDARAL